MKIKICGIQDLAAGRAACQAGADFIGFVFAAGRHHIEPDAAADICRELPYTKKVGVFVDEDKDKVNGIADLCGLDYVQLHGREPAFYAQKIKYPVIKAFHWQKYLSAQAMNEYPAELILFDTYDKEQAGGTGTAFAWSEAAGLVGEVKKPVIIAGGINSANAGKAIRLFHPLALDVSSSLEKDGRKSVQAIKKFMAVIRAEEERQR